MRSYLAACPDAMIFINYDKRKKKKKKEKTEKWSGDSLEQTNAKIQEHNIHTYIYIHTKKRAKRARRDEEFEMDAYKELMEKGATHDAILSERLVSYS